MRALASALFVLLGPASLLADGRSELDILRARCTEQERQIRTLEGEIESLHSQLALERRRSRGVEPSAAAAAALPPTKILTHVVRTGDTLSSIARRYHTSAEGLMKSNGITDPTRLRVGQKLVLPSEAKIPVATPTPKPAPEKVVKLAPPNPKPAAKRPVPTNDYKVQRGDTLYGIARRHKMTIGSLRSLNPKIEEKIVVGQTIAVTGKARQSSPSRLNTSKTHTISTRAPKPAPKKEVRKAAIKKSAPKPPVTKKPAPPKPAPAIPREAPKRKVDPPKPAPSKEKKEAPEQKIFMPKTISSVFVTEEVSFADFAKRHGTTPEQLNTLNGWDFKGSLVLAKGSEIYVPGR